MSFSSSTINDSFSILQVVFLFSFFLNYLSHDDVSAHVLRLITSLVCVWRLGSLTSRWIRPALFIWHAWLTGDSPRQGCLSSCCQPGIVTGESGYLIKHTSLINTPALTMNWLWSSKSFFPLLSYLGRKALAHIHTIVVFQIYKLAMENM